MKDIKKRLRLFDNQVALKCDTTGFSSLPKFEYFCAQENNHKWDYFHVVDLNKDGLNDLIYCGPCMPYIQVGIFITNGRNLNQVDNYLGRIISIENKSDHTTIHILDEACCCNYYSSLIEISIDTNSNVTKNVIKYFGTTQITLDKKIKEITVTGILRTSPEVNDSIKIDDCSDEVIHGNHLVQLSDQKKVIQLHKVGQWKLVLFQEDKEKSWIGWVNTN